jgi:hypothetical protein
VALERLVEASLELPAFSTLDEMATSIRAEVNAGIFAGIVSRMGTDGRQRAQGLLATAGPDGRSMFNRLKKPAQCATWSRFKAQAEYLDQVDELGDTARRRSSRRVRRRGRRRGRRHRLAQAPDDQQGRARLDQSGAGRGHLLYARAGLRITVKRARCLPRHG